MIVSVILIPFITGILVPVIPFRKRWQKEVFLETAVVLNSILVWYLLLHHSDSTFLLAHFTGNLNISFRVDGMSMVFAGLVSALWPFATLYAFEYMTKEENENVFFLFYTLTYGVTLGIALAANLLTMYFFYELLTLVTVPLVMHTLTREAVLASRKYLYYSIGGAAFAIVTFLLPRPIMRIFSTEEDVIELGAQYLRITAFIYLPHGVSLVVSNVIRSIGNAKLGLYVSIA